MKADRPWSRGMFTAIAMLGLTSVAHAKEDSSLRVMTMNMFTGTNFEELVAAQDLPSFGAAVATTIQKIISSKPSERATAMANEIAREKPHLVGLQEASILATISESSVTIEEDLVQSLLDALRELGIQYEVASVETGLDIAAPTASGDKVRLTTRDVIIARSDLPPGELIVSNPKHQDYLARPTFQTPLGPISDPSGWASVEAQIGGRDHVRFVTTHLDVNPNIAHDQAQELVQVLNQTALPTVLVCDCNSTPDLSADPTFATYRVMKDAGFHDTYRILRPNADGFTCCQDENLLNTISKLDLRVDLVQFRGTIVPIQAKVTGNRPRDKTASGLWPSDHAALAATLDISTDPADR